MPLSFSRQTAPVVSIVRHQVASLVRAYFCMAKSWRSGTHRDGVEHVVTEWNIQWLSATAPDSNVTRWRLLSSSHVARLRIAASSWYRDGVEHVVTEWNIQWLGATAPDSKRFQLLLSSVTRELHSYEYWWERIFVWLSRDEVEHTMTEWNTLWRSGIYSDWVQLHQTASVSSCFYRPSPGGVWYTLTSM